MGYGQITAELSKDQFSQELILEKSALGKAE
jgi:ribose transport system ATP-binding protein